uniref:Deleted in lung and esophageal cancer protein 1 Ig-like domain-containing protein n=1 Tax=Gadus morhua TaxID=8049 RepID=A0A8C5BSV7_GADMO
MSVHREEWKPEHRSAAALRDVTMTTQTAPLRDVTMTTCKPTWRYTSTETVQMIYDDRYSSCTKDVSHVLASIFKDAYTKEVIGRDTQKLIHHQSHQIMNYGQRMEQNDMLERHLLQARVRASESQDKSYRVFLLKSTLVWCVDNHLLKANHLIGPQDYHPRQGQPSRAPEGNPVGFSLCFNRVGTAAYAVLHCNGKIRKKLLTLLSIPPQTSVELKNLTASCRHVRVLPPTTSYFSIGLGRFPGEGGMVAPGMSCKYMVRFAPDSLGDYEDCLVVETQAPYPMVVPLVARRPPPILTLPRVLDCGYSLVGALKFVEYLCCNEGLSAGTFCVIPRSQWPSVVMTSFAEEPPFAVGPSLFQLQPGQATVLEVSPSHTHALCVCWRVCVFLPVCVVVCVCLSSGEGQTIALELISVSGENTLPVVGEAQDLSAEHFVRFPSCHPQCVERRATHGGHVCSHDLDLPFFWQIMRPNLQWLLPGEEANPDRILFHPAADLVFNVSPLIGCLAPRLDQEFEFTYLPKEVRIQT